MASSPTPPELPPNAPPPVATRRVLLVTGLSGAGKSSILRILEDLGHEVVDNPPIGMLDALVTRAGTKLAIGVDVRSRGFEAALVLRALASLRSLPDIDAELIFATAETPILLRRFTATRRRHPLAASGAISQGIEQETALLAPLRASADLLVDTSDLPPPALRRMIETHFGPLADDPGEGLALTLMSFAYPAGLPREADLVFDARFLRNPHYDPALQPLTGLDAPVKAYVAADPDYARFLDLIRQTLALVLPRFVAEGKKYATVAIGCSGGKHRSVTLVEALAQEITEKPACSTALAGWPVVVLHRELGIETRHDPGKAWRAPGNTPSSRVPAAPLPPSPT
ncbi:RNase adapter RapZ [Tanticharoenia sakaeratensis]|jgi:RNase adapter protein RapZ|uniref:Uncharacterized protein n=1 Tax=Tanticharoenia sakaeratensis NBRC 103193 TaxID=1231623 RepID=A0A0D6MMN1_9PROT|nr:RNase adapter RapZ [Tanticharoenia sakaeratensis]GAN54680.1 hypothetical protein Tasa_028_047 [Tanticharoenia sakaeratensis NBRC 103193]GBQ16792.1 ATPase [Tanticharoenia sakaeratensis NBRC 103193]